MPSIAVLAVATCVLALVAAGVAFAAGSWLGVPFLLLAAVGSNVALAHARRRRAARARG
jgi:hypothetical protein